jgi:hypothetical protein
MYVCKYEYKYVCMCVYISVCMYVYRPNVREGAKTNGRKNQMGAKTNGRQKWGVDRDFLLVEED